MPIEQLTLLLANNPNLPISDNKRSAVNTYAIQQFQYIMAMQSVNSNT